MQHPRLLTLLALLALIIAGIPCGVLAQKPQKSTSPQGLRTVPVHLPAELDDLFPPKAQEPVLLLKMHAMGTALTGMLADLMEKDLVNAKANYDQFRREYSQTSTTVREWTLAFSKEPVDQLGKALGTGDQQKVMKAVEKVGQVCENCHMHYMTPVQQKYHWPDFRNVGVTDPIMKEPTNYAGLMQGLNLGFTGIGVDLQEGQVEEARKHFDAFRARVETLKETCIACHDTDRKYYVDGSVMSSIDQLGAAIASPSIDQAKVKQLSMSIGNESCFKCHLVHLPAAHAKAKWGPPAL